MEVIKMKIKGSCLCGEIKYEVAGELSNVTHCHCSMCRKAHGAAFATFATVEPDKFQWISGTDLVTKYVSSPELERYFCRKCGDSLAAAENGKITDITLGTIDSDPGVRPESHIFVGSIAPWYEITDSLPQYDEYPPDNIID